MSCHETGNLFLPAFVYPIDRRFLGGFHDQDQGPRRFMPHPASPGRLLHFRHGRAPGGFLEDPAPQGRRALLPRERQRRRPRLHLERGPGRDQGRQVHPPERGGAGQGRDPGRGDRRGSLGQGHLAQVPAPGQRQRRFRDPPSRRRRPGRGRDRQRRDRGPRPLHPGRRGHDQRLRHGRGRLGRARSRHDERQHPDHAGSRAASRPTRPTATSGSRASPSRAGSRPARPTAPSPCPSSRRKRSTRTSPRTRRTALSRWIFPVTLKALRQSKRHVEAKIGQGGLPIELGTTNGSITLTK
ncbi:MAG: hypothetical protein MZV64_43790 [Ignavibacteriales bacterium]|nr:hypothetical protein [Ignavibacteriales bacterium]